MNEIYLFKKRLIHELFPVTKLHASLTVLVIYGGKKSNFNFIQNVFGVGTLAVASL